MASLINFACNLVDLAIERYKIGWMIGDSTDRIKNDCSNDCYCKPETSTPQLDLELLQRYARLRENGKFLDLEILCSDGSTRSVHKFILNSLSVKLGRSILELGDSDVSFEAPVEVLDALIELAYTSKLNLTGVHMDTIGQLLTIASSYDINSLKQELSCHIKSTLSLSNALEFFHHASENGLCLKDIQLIRAYILKKNFMALNEQSNEFSKISHQDLESFIMDDNLGLKEKELFNIITGWVKNRYPDRAYLLNHVRYQYMDEDFSPMNFFKNVRNFFKNVWKLMKNPMSPFIRQSLTNRGSMELNPRNPKEMVLAIGGGHCSNCAMAHIEIGANFGVLTQPWKEVKAIYNMPGERAFYGIGLVNNILYVFGGFGSDKRSTRSTFAFDTIKKVSR